MADLDPRAAATAGPAAGQPHCNGATETATGQAARAASADGAPSGAAEEADDRSGLDRAEELVDRMAAQASTLVVQWGRKFLRFSSRARESVQDFWAEVQDFRHGKKPD